MPRSSRRMDDDEGDGSMMSPPVRQSQPSGASPNNGTTFATTTTPMYDPANTSHPPNNHNNNNTHTSNLGYQVPLTNQSSALNTPNTGSVPGGAPAPMVMQVPLQHTQQGPMLAPMPPTQGYQAPSGTTFISPALAAGGYPPGVAPMQQNYAAIIPAAYPGGGTTFTVAPNQGHIVQQPMMSNNVALAPNPAPPVNQPSPQIQVAVPLAPVRAALPHEVQTGNNIDMNRSQHAPSSTRTAMTRESGATMTTAETQQPPQDVNPSTMEQGTGNNEKKSKNEDRNRSSGRSSRRRVLYIVLGILAVILGVGLAVGVLLMMNSLRGEEKSPSESPTPLPSTSPTSIPSLNPTPYPSTYPTSNPTTPPTEMPVPTFSPTTAVWGFLLEALEIDDVDALDVNENAALRWMTTEDPLRDVFLERSTTTNSIVLEDNIDDVRFRYVMTLFYYSTGGDVTWTSQHNFLTDRPTCDWNEPSDAFTVGVICSATTGEFLGIQMCTFSFSAQHELTMFPCSYHL